MSEHVKKALDRLQYSNQKYPNVYHIAGQVALVERQ